MRSSLRLLALMLGGGAMSAQPAGPLIEPAVVSISVLSLFHPQTLIVASKERLTLNLDSHPVSLAPGHSATLVHTPGGLSIRIEDERVLNGSTLEVLPASFTLTVPGKLARAYRGALTVSSSSGALSAVIAMPVELAVASIVQAEAPPHATLEALEVQAIVSRSFLLARPSAHAAFDACDTTHCQFLRSPPSAQSSAARATLATRNMVVVWRPNPGAPPVIVRAMFSQRCGGHTHSHPSTTDAYPYYPVGCSFCLRHPDPWHSPPLPRSGTPLTERQRLTFNRAHGWSALPSSLLRSTTLGVEGDGVGHDIGLCQLGAADMAAHGANYEKIIFHYFPNTTLVTLPSAP